MIMKKVVYKYIIFKAGGILNSIVFPKNISHYNMELDRGVAVSAGLVKFIGKFPICYGRSNSLKLHSKFMRDSEIILMNGWS